MKLGSDMPEILLCDSFSRFVISTQPDIALDGAKRAPSH